MDDGDLFTIGQLARRTGLTVKTIRYWSDLGAVPPTERTPAGYRRYDAQAVARLELVRTLRDLGLPLEQVRTVLDRERTVAEVAAVHAEALEARIRVLRLQRAVLRSVAQRQSTAEELTVMTKLAHLSAAERNKIIEDFVEEMVAGLDLPEYRKGMLAATPDLPDDPAPWQVDAWIELAELVRDPEFRTSMRRMAEEAATSNEFSGPDQDHEAARRQAEEGTRLVADKAGAALAADVAPDSPAAAPVLDELMGTWAAVHGLVDSAEFRRRLYDGLSVTANPKHERYRQLLCIINGWEPVVTQGHGPAFDWLLAALAAHPEPTPAG